jgi:hypothetical protein
MATYENLKEDLRKIIGGTVESAFELKQGRGLFVTIRTHRPEFAYEVPQKTYTDAVV